MDPNRRHFIKATTLAATSGILWPGKILASPAPVKKIRILVWDERSDTQKEAYDHFLGNYISGRLALQPEFSVISAGLDDPLQGLSGEVLDKTDLLIWWGHTRQAEISPETGRDLVRRISEGTLSLIALHSAHWSTPFVEAMYEITRRNLTKKASIGPQDLTYIRPSEPYKAPGYDQRVTPYTVERKFPDGSSKYQVHLPICCFPAYRNDGKPSTVKVRLPDHPIMQALPSEFTLSNTEMYDEPFHVPEPDSVLMEECWAGGEWFRSAMLWKLDKGHVFYFRPGHEAYPVYKDQKVMQILSNAAKWLAHV